MSFANANNTTFANNGQIDQQDDQYDEECDTNVPMYEGELCNEWRFSCALCFTASGFTPTSRQSLPNFLVHLIEEHAEGEALDIIARVTLAQYPPLRCGPSKAGRGSSSRGSSVDGGSVQGSSQGSLHGSVRGGSVRGGSVHGSVNGSVKGSTRGGYMSNRGSAAHATRSSRPTQPAPVTTAPALSRNEMYQQMLAQNQAMMAHMQAHGLGDMTSLSSAVNNMQD